MMNDRRILRRRKPNIRNGALLFETLIALFVLLVGMVSIGQYLTNAARGSTQGRLTAEGTLYCEAQLNTLLASEQILEPQGIGVFEVDPDWSWEYRLEPAAVVGLQELTVSVSYVGSERNPVWSATRLFRPPLTEETAGGRLP